MQIAPQPYPYSDASVRIYGYRSSDATFQPLRLDKATNSIQTIDYAHHEIHSGSHFFVVGVQDLSINQVLDFTWVMPNTTKWIHWLWKFDTESETAWYVYENAIITILFDLVVNVELIRHYLTALGNRSIDDGLDSPDFDVLNHLGSCPHLDAQPCRKLAFSCQLHDHASPSACHPCRFHPAQLFQITGFSFGRIAF